MATKANRIGDAVSGLDRRRRSANESANETYAAKRNDIVHAAVRLFTENGYEATKFVDIGRAVDVDRATLYYYFNSKVDLLASAIADVLSVGLADVEAIVDSDDDALTKLRRALRSSLTVMYERHPFSTLLFQDDIWRSSQNAEWIVSLRQDFERATTLYRRIVEDGQRDGSIRDDLAAELITQVVVGSISWTYRWLKPGDGHDIDDVIRTFDGILCTGAAPTRKTCRFTGEPRTGSR
ncbi:TetR/AcrR family transcriptional regulator [Mycobacterium sp. NPDC003449]